MTNRLTAIDLAEAFYLAHAATALAEEGVIDALAGETVDGAAAGLDPGWVRTLLEFLAERTDLIERTTGGYAPTPAFDATARYVLGQFVGAYGPNAAALRVLLHDPSAASSLVDRESHATAYAHTPSFIVRLVADVVVRLGLDNVLDLGCGPGWLLAQLATQTRTRLWGMDSNPAMRALALQRIHDLDALDRVTVVDGDVSDVESSVGSWRSEVETITAISVANGFFAHGTDAVVAWLRSLHRAFPDRALILGDYYGQIGRRPPPWHRLLELQDIAQLVSGQGIPPGGSTEWLEIYETADCQLIHMIEDEDATFFVHIIRL